MITKSQVINLYEKLKEYDKKTIFSYSEISYIIELIKQDFRERVSEGNSIDSK